VRPEKGAEHRPPEFQPDAEHRTLNEVDDEFHCLGVVSLVRAVPATRRSQEAVMSMPPDVPETIQNATLLIRQILAKSVLTQQDREAIRKARLKVAFWACVTEKITPTHDNLVYILGSTAHEVIGS